MSDQFGLKSFVVSPDNGEPLSLRVVLPPNLPDAAGRDRIAIKLEVETPAGVSPANGLDCTHAYWAEPPELLAIRLIESWCEGKLPGLLQLTRDQLSQLLAPLTGQPRIFSNNGSKQPLQWEGGQLPGVHEHLRVEAPKDTSTPSEINGCSRQEATDQQVRKLTAEPDLTPMKVDGSTEFVSIELPDRESCLYSCALDIVKTEQFVLDASLRRYFLRGQHKTLNFLAKHLDELRHTFRANFTENFKKRALGSFKEARLHAETSPGPNGTIQLNVAIRVKGVHEATINEAIRKGERFVATRGKKFVLIPDSVQSALNLIRESIDDTPEAATTAAVRSTITPAEVPSIHLLLKENRVDFKQSEIWADRVRAFQKPQSLKMPKLSDLLRDTLRPYQRIGVAWLWNLYKTKLGGILADEMGLGKTIQALCVMEAVHRAQRSRPILVVCPASLIENWKREANRFVPELPVCLHHGAGRATEPLALDRGQLVITSYQTLAKDAELLESITFAVVVADEAQHVRNSGAQAAVALRRLQTAGRFILTGTPIENRIEDLLSLFEFLMPGFLKRPRKGIAADERRFQLELMRNRAAPYILRRSKAQVAPELPAKIEQLVYCEMTSQQQRLYDHWHKDFQAEVAAAEATGKNNHIQVLNQLTRLRQVCADPRLLDKSLPPESSSKLQALAEILEESIDGGHRLLIFSQFTSILDLLQKALDEWSIKYLRLDGATRKRQALVDRFNNDSTIPVFLISLKAGGTGLNLTGADTVILYDPWWNPASESQAMDRAHRIGQTRTVNVFKLVAANTVEERVVNLQQTKAQALAELLEVSQRTNAATKSDFLKTLQLIAN